MKLTRFASKIKSPLPPLKKGELNTLCRGWRDKKIAFRFDKESLRNQKNEVFISPFFKGGLRGGASSRCLSKNLGGVVFGFNLFDNILDFSLFINNKGSTNGSHILTTVHGFFLPYAILFVHCFILISN